MICVHIICDYYDLGMEKTAMPCFYAENVEDVR